MFTKIRYRFQSKLRAITAWLGRPRAVEVATQDVVKSMEHLGITVVDASIYPKSRNDKIVGSAVVVAGYIPGKALIFKVKFNYGTFDDYTFTVEGQLKESVMGFPKLERSFVGGEYYGIDGMFQVNDHTGYNHMRCKSSLRKVVYGMDFFRSFLDNYSALVRPFFDSNVHLWFVPEYSDEYEALEEKNGKYSENNYTVFNSRVMEKFPEGFFCESQRA